LKIKIFFVLDKKSALLFGAILATFMFTLSAQGQRILVRPMEYTGDEPARQDSFRKLHIVIAGNIYKSQEQIKNAYDSSERKFDFAPELRHVNPIMNIGDIVLAQLKTSFQADPSSPYSAPDEFALSIKYAGINHCMLANKNTMNIEKKSLVRTQKAMRVFDIQTTGAFSDNRERNGNYPLFIEKKGFKIAVLNYVAISRRPSISLDYVINQLDQNQIERDMKVARDQNPDYIIVYIDWGDNFQDYPSLNQETTAKFIFEQGADLIVGTFPNTVKKTELVEHYYKGELRNKLVVYSLGNLISESTDDRSKAGAFLDIEIHKNNFTGQVKEGDIGFIPTWNHYDTINGKMRLQVLPVAAVEQGDMYKNMAADEKKKMIQYAFQTRRTMGRYTDEIQYNITDITVEDMEESTQLTNSPMNNRFNPFSEKNLKASAPPAAKVEQKHKGDTIYRIQFYDLSKLIPIDTTYYDHLKGYEVLKENDSYKYLLGNSTHYKEIKELFFRVIKPRYKQSFIAVYYDGRRIKEFTPKE